MLRKMNLRHGQQLCHVSACWWGFLYPKHRGMISLLVNELTTFVNSLNSQSFLRFAGMKPVLGLTSPTNNTIGTAGIAAPGRYGISIPDAQAWIHLKLQGFFTDDDNEGQSPAKTCSFCGLATPENVNHLFVHCAACRQILPAALLMASRDHFFSGPSSSKRG